MTIFGQQPACVSLQSFASIVFIERRATCPWVDEASPMKRFLILSGFLLGAVFLPLVVTADDHYDKRYRDRQGRDYHVYNNEEDRAYRFYLGERHQPYREFSRIRRSQQEQYFRWRHLHPDSVLFKVAVR
jgi:hypothetical protein